MLRTIRKIAGKMFTAWGAIRLVVDAAESIRATTSYARNGYVQLATFPTSRSLTAAVLVIGIGLLFAEQIKAIPRRVKKWWDEESHPQASAGDSKGYDPTLLLRIKSAKYGVGGDRYQEVTPIVKSYLKGNKLSMLVSNWTICSGRDPYYGEQKHIIVEYSIGNGPIKEIVRRELDQLELPEESEKSQPGNEAKLGTLAEQIFSLCRELATFIAAQGPRPDEDESFNQTRTYDDQGAEYMRRCKEEVLPWDTKISAGYWLTFRDEAVNLRHKLAIAGLSDDELNKALTAVDKQAEDASYAKHLRAITERMMVLAARLG